MSEQEEADSQQQREAMASAQETPHPTITMPSTTTTTSPNDDDVEEEVPLSVAHSTDTSSMYSGDAADMLHNNNSNDCCYNNEDHLSVQSEPAAAFGNSSSLPSFRNRHNQHKTSSSSKDPRAFRARPVPRSTYEYRPPQQQQQASTTPSSGRSVQSSPSTTAHQNKHSRTRLRGARVVVYDNEEDDTRSVQSTQSASAASLEGLHTGRRGFKARPLPQSTYVYKPPKKSSRQEDASPTPTVAASTIEPRNLAFRHYSCTAEDMEESAEGHVHDDACHHHSHNKANKKKKKKPKDPTLFRARPLPQSTYDYHPPPAPTPPRTPSSHTTNTTTPSSRDGNEEEENVEFRHYSCTASDMEHDAAVLSKKPSYEDPTLFHARPLPSSTYEYQPPPKTPPRRQQHQLHSNSSTPCNGNTVIAEEEEEIVFRHYSCTASDMEQSATAALVVNNGDEGHEENNGGEVQDHHDHDHNHHASCQHSKKPKTKVEDPTLFHARPVPLSTYQYQPPRKTTTPPRQTTQPPSLSRQPQPRSLQLSRSMSDSGSELTDIYLLDNVLSEDDDIVEDKPAKEPKVVQGPSMEKVGGPQTITAVQPQTTTQAAAETTPTTKALQPPLLNLSLISEEGEGEEEKNHSNNNQEQPNDSGVGGGSTGKELSFSATKTLPDNTSATTASPSSASMWWTALIVVVFLVVYWYNSGTTSSFVQLSTVLDRLEYQTFQAEQETPLVPPRSVLTYTYRRQRRGGATLPTSGSYPQQQQQQHDEPPNRRHDAMDPETEHDDNKEAGGSSVLLLEEDEEDYDPSYVAVGADNGNNNDPISHSNLEQKHAPLSPEKSPDDAGLLSVPHTLLPEDEHVDPNVVASTDIDNKEPHSDLETEHDNDDHAPPLSPEKSPDDAGGSSVPQILSEDEEVDPNVVAGTNIDGKEPHLDLEHELDNDDQTPLSPEKSPDEAGRSSVQLEDDEEDNDPNNDNATPVQFQSSIVQDEETQPPLMEDETTYMGEDTNDNNEPTDMPTSQEETLEPTEEEVEEETFQQVLSPDETISAESTVHEFAATDDEAEGQLFVDTEKDVPLSPMTLDDSQASLENTEEAHLPTDDANDNESDDEETGQQIQPHDEDIISSSLAPDDTTDRSLPLTGTEDALLVSEEPEGGVGVEETLSQANEGVEMDEEEMEMLQGSSHDDISSPTIQQQQDVDENLEHGDESGKETFVVSIGRRMVASRRRRAPYGRYGRRLPSREPMEKEIVSQESEEEGSSGSSVVDDEHDEETDPDEEPELATTQQPPPPIAADYKNPALREYRYRSIEPIHKCTKTQLRVPKENWSRWVNEAYVL